MTDAKMDGQKSQGRGWSNLSSFTYNPMVQTNEIVRRKITPMIDSRTEKNQAVLRTNNALGDIQIILSVRTYNVRMTVT